MFYLLTSYLRSRIVLLWLSLFFLVAVWWQPIFLLVLFPGCLILTIGPAKKWELSEFLVAYFLTSLIGWIAAFTVLKFIPLSLSQFMIAVVSLSYVGTLIWYQPNTKITHSLSSYAALGLLGILIYLFIVPMKLVLAPAGIDMATHSYVARTILFHQTFPTTHFPIVPIKAFGHTPIGLPILMALLSQIGDIDLEQVANILSCLTYPITAFALYFFARRFFSPFGSLLAIFYIFFIGQDVTGYLNWGANPTILGMAFMAFALGIACDIITKNTFTFSQAIWLGSVVGASFLTHQIPLLATAYFFLPAGLLLLPFIWRQKSWWPLGIVTALVIVITALPFLMAMKPLDEFTTNSLRKWQQNHPTLSIGKNVSSYWIDVPTFFERKIGYRATLFIFASIILTATIKRKRSLVFISAAAMLGLLLINSQHWFLPLSPALYSDRVFVSATPIFIFFIAHLFEQIINWFSHIRPKFSQAKLATLLAVIWLPYMLVHYLTIAKDNYAFILKMYEAQSSLSPDDQKVFAWIENNVQLGEVIDNNYGDAGPWLPALTGKMIYNNDASPHDFSEFEAFKKTAPKNYVFIGSKIIDPDHMEYSIENLQNNPDYELLFASNNSQFYRNLKPYDN